MNTYKFATDATAGTVDAENLEAAFAALAAKITPEMIADGATLWVADESTGERITL